MAGPWEAYQDISGAQLARNDQTVTAPARAPVPSTNRVWGDAEAQQAGLYESPQKSGPWDAFKPKAPLAMPADRAPTRITVNPVSSRFTDIPQIGGDQLQQGLNQRGLELTRGPEVSPSAQMAGEAANLLPAATQGTSPHVSDYGGQVVSTEAHQDDAGNILYRDPQTGQLKPTNNETQVAIRDPADGVVKVFNRTEATNENPAVGVSRVLAPGLTAGAPTARAAGAAKNLIPTASDIFSTSKVPYRAFTQEASKIEVPVETAQGIGERMHRALDRLNLDAEMAGAPAKAAIKRLESPSETMTLDYLQRVKRVAGRGFGSHEKDVRDGAAALTGEIEKVIKEVSPSAYKNLKTGDAIHQTALASKELQQKAAMAGLRTGSAGYGGNAVNHMRQQLRPIVDKWIKEQPTKFKPNELQAMHQIVEGTRGSNIARGIGQASPSKGAWQTMSELGAVAGGFAAAGPAGAVAALAIPALGAASNKLATILTARQINRLRELVAKRSPAYAEAVAKAVTRWENAQIALENNATTNKFADYIAASRLLAAGLTRDGIQIKSGDLIRQLSGPVKSAADAEQNQSPNVPGQ